jgi:hypothetical protein
MPSFAASHQQVAFGRLPNKNIQKHKMDVDRKRQRFLSDEANVMMRDLNAMDRKSKELKK